MVRGESSQDSREGIRGEGRRPGRLYKATQPAFGEEIPQSYLTLRKMQIAIAMRQKMS